jgi:hypothetical protein
MAIKTWILRLRFATRRITERRQWDPQTIIRHTGAQSQNIYMMQVGLLTENCCFQQLHAKCLPLSWQSAPI